MKFQPVTILQSLNGEHVADSTDSARRMLEADPTNQGLKSWIEVVQFIEVPD